MKNYKSVDEYIQKADKDHKEKLKTVRQIVLDINKNITESISYGMPAYKWHEKPLFYFAAMKGHLGLYPTTSPIVEFKKELEKFSTSKGCVRLPYKENVPKGLITKLIKFRMKEIDGNKKM